MILLSLPMWGRNRNKTHGEINASFKETKTRQVLSVTKDPQMIP